MKHAVYNWNYALHRYHLLRQAGFAANSINLSAHKAPRTAWQDAKDRVQTRLRLAE